MEAFEELLEYLPSDPGMAFVLIQHLAPTHKSLLSDALGKKCVMPVLEVEDGMVVRSNHVYVIPPNADLGILKGCLTLLPRSKDTHKLHLPIDFFLSSLAAELGSRAIGVVLSGTGADGTAGLRAIKAAEGVTFAQAPRSARFGGMPENAIQAGVVDFNLPIPQIAEQLLRIGRHPYLREQETAPEPSEQTDLKKILVLVRNQVGVDFSDYKATTIKRRVSRRMALTNRTSLADYVKLLREDHTEIQALYEDVLIHVTSFFRDAGVFDKLKESIFPQIMKSLRPDETLRIWVAGCSTGEEAYSLAICLIEFLSEHAPETSFQIFGTDISEKAIERARTGVYAESIARDLSPERQSRFFTHIDGGYRINKSVREHCVFVRHNIAVDPPFSRLHLMSCRNLLIYFNQAMQRRVLSILHFALNMPGFLLLGRTEGLADSNHLFAIVDKENKIFSRTAAPSSLRLSPAREYFPLPTPHIPPSAPARPSLDIAKQFDSLLLAQYAPPGVIVNDHLDILLFRGRTGAYLEPAPGQPQHNLFKMAREGLLADLRIAFSEARREKALVRRPGVRVRQNGSVHVCDLVVIPVAPVPESEEKLFAVLFEEAPPAPEASQQGAAQQAEDKPFHPLETQHVVKLEQELVATREYLQSLIDEHQKTNDDLLSANEELVSSNEELQSLNEELSTAKEELQSTNEELTTLNDELRSRNTELDVVNNDLLNVLSSVEIPIVIVDGTHRIRRFTPRARKLLNILPSDIGRPIDDIRPNLDIERLGELISEVIETLSVKEMEVQSRDGGWYRLQIRPYLSADKKIDGAVLSIVDINALKQALTTAEWAREYAENTVDAVQTPLAVLDQALRLCSANGAFHQAFATSQAATEGLAIAEVGGGLLAVPALLDALRETLQKNTCFQSLELELESPELGRRWLSASGRLIPSLGGKRMILLALEDITGRRQGESERARLLAAAEEAKAKAEEANRTKDIFLAMLSHELRTPLSTLLLQANMLRRGHMDDEKLRRAAESIERATKAQAQLIDDLLDISRIVTGKLAMECEAVELGGPVGAALEAVKPMAEKKSIALEVSMGGAPLQVWGDPIRLQQIVWNLLTNAIKFTPEGGRVSLELERRDHQAQLRVRDTGIGIEPRVLSRIFEMFVQADSSSTRAHGGLGLGLAIVRHLVEVHGGRVEVESAGKGQGATFTVLLPLFDEGKEPRRLAPEAPPPVESSAPHVLEGVRILIVEDDPGTREVLMESLGFLGARVQAVGSVAEAMEVFETFKPELLISDIAMPIEDGYGLIRKIRALGKERGGDVPALALTALARAEDQKRALAEGFQAHLAKPIKFDRLEEVLGELLKKAGQTPRAVP